MTRNIPETDWKVFRELHQVALGRLCDRILAEARTQIEQPTKSAHEKYLDLFKLIHDRNRDLARAFDDFRRSTAIMQIGIIYSMGLFTPEELERFSPETRSIIEQFRVQ
jgi:hypothetical protein